MLGLETMTEKQRETRAAQQEKGYWLVARERFDEYKDNLKTMQFTIGRVEIGTAKPVIIAGPCTVHSRDQTIETALRVMEGGADLLRGGAYKPRTSPYSFQGLGLEGLKYLAEARDRTGLPIVSEVLDQHKVEEVGSYADVLQIGARNMQNFALLQDVGKYAARHDKAVLLKTGPKPKLKEVLCATEYLALEYDQQGKEPAIILCERGINEPSKGMRNTPQPDFLYQLRKATYLPVIGDPSHSSGHRELVPKIGRKYLDAAANGLIIDVIRDDEKPQIDGVDVCDYDQGMRASAFMDFASEIKRRRVRQR